MTTKQCELSICNNADSLYDNITDNFERDIEKSLNYTGTSWLPYQLYNKDDIVTYNGSIYMSKRNYNRGIIPIDNENYWIKRSTTIVPQNLSIFAFGKLQNWNVVAKSDNINIDIDSDSNRKITITKADGSDFVNPLILVTPGVNNTDDSTKIFVRGGSGSSNESAIKYRLGEWSGDSNLYSGDSEFIIYDIT